MNEKAYRVKPRKAEKNDTHVGNGAFFLVLLMCSEVRLKSYDFNYSNSF